MRSLIVFLKPSVAKRRASLTIGPIGLLLVAASFMGCQVRRPELAGGPVKVDSAQLGVSLQERRDFRFAGGTLGFSNAFAAARLNGVTQLNDSTFSLSIAPENAPINPSPWYAFKVWSATPRRIYFQLDYGRFKHRYDPKISYDKVHWQELGGKDTFSAVISNDTALISGQELIDAAQVYRWTAGLARQPFVKRSIIGYSMLGRPIEVLATARRPKKPVVVLMGRQHPPEISGFMALQAFVEEVFGTSERARRFREHVDVVCIPMINPDGVDEGGWRHNMAGVDLNRDWEGFKQPETRAVKAYLERLVEQGDVDILFALDFHSTYHDVFYTNKPSAGDLLPGFADRWIHALERDVPGYTASIKPSPNGGNVSKGWLSRRFGAEAITYEVGDNTPRPLIRQVAQAAAKRMMEMLPAAVDQP